MDEKQEPRVFIHPGYVVSKRDGQEHFITFHQLCHLYQVDPSKAINAQLGLGRSRDNQSGDRHLYPRYNGDYPLFDKESNG